jgi:hypothetical protein
MDISGQLHTTATLPLDVESAPDTHWVQGWVGNRASLDTVEERKTTPLLGTELRFLGRLVIISNELSQLLVNKSPI